MRDVRRYRFREGDTFALDDIYEIQGLGGGSWWEKAPDGGDGIDMSDLCVCTRGVTITVQVKYDPSPARAGRSP